MKFGKEFQQILDDSKFPDDWKSSAIEYRQVRPTLSGLRYSLCHVQIIRL